MFACRKDRGGKVSPGLVSSPPLSFYIFPQHEVNPKINSLSGCQKQSVLFFQLLSNRRRERERNKEKSTFFPNSSKKCFNVFQVRNQSNGSIKPSLLLNEWGQRPTLDIFIEMDYVGPQSEKQGKRGPWSFPLLPLALGWPPGISSWLLLCSLEGEVSPPLPVSLSWSSTTCHQVSRPESQDGYLVTHLPSDSWPIPALAY